MTILDEAIIVNNPRTAIARSDKSSPHEPSVLHLPCGGDVSAVQPLCLSQLISGTCGIIERITAQRPVLIPAVAD